MNAVKESIVARRWVKGEASDNGRRGQANSSALNKRGESIRIRTRHGVRAGLENNLEGRGSPHRLTVGPNDWFEAPLPNRRDRALVEICLKPAQEPDSRYTSVRGDHNIYPDAADDSIWGNSRVLGTIATHAVGPRDAVATRRENRFRRRIGPTLTLAGRRDLVAPDDDPSNSISSPLRQIVNTDPGAGLQDHLLARDGDKAATFCFGRPVADLRADGEFYLCFLVAFDLDNKSVTRLLNGNNFSE